MTTLLNLLHLTRPRRIPGQVCVSSNCRTPDCPRFRRDVLPELGNCPACNQPLTRTVTR